MNLASARLPDAGRECGTPGFAALLAARRHLTMHAADGLCLDGVPLHAIADAHGTPSWVYSAATLRARHATLRDAFAAAGLAPRLHYAVKANDHLAILNIIGRLGAGADVVSLGEMLRAQRAGIAADRIVFSGVGKTVGELSAALTAGIGQINVESPAELASLSALASAQNRTARIVLRVNPDVDAGTHAKITTGRADNKFGIAAAEVPDLYAHAARLPGITPVGLALHIGSQILATAPYITAYTRAAELIRGLRGAGHIVDVLDLGGGLGIGYADKPGLSPSAYAHAVRRTVGALGLDLVLEPGRFLAGPAGLLLTAVILQKQAGAKRFIVLDAAMNDLMRPALYESWHAILPVSPVDYLAPTSPADLVGPVCETGDRLAAHRPMPELRPGARLAILDAGAYGAVMSSTYNARPRAAAIMVEAGEARLITRRQTHDSLWADEIIPA